MQHMPKCPSLLVGVGVSPIEKSESLLQGQPQYLKNFATQILEAKANLDQEAGLCWSVHGLPDRKPLLEDWELAAQQIGDQDLYRLWNAFTNQSQGSRKQHWQPDVIRRLIQAVPRANVIVIPAIREIGAKGTMSDEFDGTGDRKSVV